MSVILVVEQDDRNIHWTHHYLQSRVNYPQSVTYQRYISGGNGTPRRNTVRVEAHEKLYIGAGCAGVSYTDLCGSLIQTQILAVAPIRSTTANADRSGDSEEDSAIEYGLDFVPQRAISEPVEEQQD